MVDRNAAARLVEAREARGYKTALQFAQAHDIPQATYQLHETGGRGLRKDVAQRYADWLAIPVEWLERGTGPHPFSMAGAEFDPDAPPLPVVPQPGMSAIDEVNIDAANALSGAINPLAETHDGEHVVARWQMPTSVVRAVTPAPLERIKIITARGDSNKPDIYPGDKLLVDTTDHNPSEPGYFALWDDGQLIKRVEIIPYSIPKRARLISANPDKDLYPTREYLVSDLIFSGRIVGKWDRL
jgi:hypothetical protein